MCSGSSDVSGVEYKLSKNQLFTQHVQCMNSPGITHHHLFIPGCCAAASNAAAPATCSSDVPNALFGIKALLTLLKKRAFQSSSLG